MRPYKYLLALITAIDTIVDMPFVSISLYLARLFRGIKAGIKHSIMKTESQDYQISDNFG